MPDRLKVEYVALDSLHPFEGNPRKGDIEAIAKSLHRFGQRKPVVAMKDDGTIIAGNHIWLAARGLGWDALAVTWFPGTPEEGKAFLLADNRTSELGTFSEAELLALLQEVNSFEGDLLESASYSEEDLADLLHSTTPPPLAHVSSQAGEPVEFDTWPTVRVKLSPPAYAMWQAYAARYPDETGAFMSLLERAAAAAS
jgi:hypothetical protein